VCAELKKTLPALQVIMVTVYEDSERIFKALKPARADLSREVWVLPEQLMKPFRDVFSAGRQCLVT